MRYTEFAKKFVAGLLERTKGTEFEKVQKEILAQWILESDHFRSPLATKHCNVGGIKAGRGYPKPHGEVEYTDWQGKTDKYCALSTPEEFADLYFWFLSRNSRYLKALDYIRNPPASDDFVGDNYIYLLSIDGYCTDIANPVTNLEELYNLAEDVGADQSSRIFSIPYMSPAEQKKEIVAWNYMVRVLQVAQRPATEALLKSAWTDRTAAMFGAVAPIEIEERPDWLGLDTGIDIFGRR